MGVYVSNRSGMFRGRTKLVTCDVMFVMDLTHGVHDPHTYLTSISWNVLCQRCYLQDCQCIRIASHMELMQHESLQYC